MIWVGGRIVADDGLAISVLDRTFEHGLGLFETFRTWNGHPTLMPRHLERLRRSARELGLPLDPAQLPDAAAVAELLRADRREGDAMLRIVLCGGIDESNGSTLWMRSAPLPPPFPEGGAILFPNQPHEKTLRTSREDILARHKTLNYWRYRIAYQKARAAGADEAAMMGSSSLYTEGSRTNLFLVAGGRLTTPGLEAPVLPGIMRSQVLERAAALGIETSQNGMGLSTFDLRPSSRLIAGQGAIEMFLTNSVRGIVPVRRFLGVDLAAPGPLTARLWDDILPWLEAGGPPR
jgi:branched-subunit amino acid aminotransferase/4-amino-4-deoxychorismate lyase